MAQSCKEEKEDRDENSLLNLLSLLLQLLKLLIGQQIISYKVPENNPWQPMKYSREPDNNAHLV